MLGKRVEVRDAINGLPVQRIMGKFLVNDATVTTSMRITAEPAPELPAGSLGVRWTGVAGDGTGKVPQQVDIDGLANEIAGGLGLLSPTDRAKVMQTLSKFSGRTSNEPSATGITSRDTGWAQESADQVRLNIERNKNVAKTYADFWNKQAESMQNV